MKSLETSTVALWPHLAMAAVICGNVLGNIFIKLGSVANSDRTLLFGMFGWQTLVGAGCFAAGLMSYAWALKYLPLHMAQAIAALQFVGVILAAVLVFGESIGQVKWVGIAMIATGLLLVTR